MKILILIGLLLIGGCCVTYNEYEIYNSDGEYVDTCENSYDGTHSNCIHYDKIDGAGTMVKNIEKNSCCEGCDKE